MAECGVGLRVGVALAVLTAGQMMLAPRVDAQAPNDLFANAQVLPSIYGSVLGYNFGAFKEAGEPDHAGNTGGASVWYSWTAPATATVTLDTCATNSLDTLLAVYTGTQVNALTPVASNNDACGIKSKLKFDATSGATYMIAIDGFGGANGSLDLDISSTPANDDFADATVVTGLPVAVNGTLTDGGTKETGEDNHAGNVGGSSVWFDWTAPSTGSVTISTCDSAFQTLLAVYTGSAVNSLTPVASNQNGCGNRGIVTFAATSGVTYHIAVDGAFVLYDAEAGTLGLDIVATPPNDDFADAEPLVGLPVTTTGTNIGSTKETGEPDHVTPGGGTSVWYSWTAPSSGNVIADLCNSDFDTLVAVYTGTAVNSLTTIGGNNDACGTKSQFIWTAAAGTTYRIAVDSFGPPGMIDLRLDVSVSPPTTTTTTTTVSSATTTTLDPTIDATAPETTIDVGPRAKSRKRKVRFEFSANEAGATFECRMDAKPFEACTSPLLMKKVKRGKRLFQVRATDGAGNTDQTPAEQRFKIKR